MLDASQQGAQEPLLIGGVLDTLVSQGPPSMQPGFFVNPDIDYLTRTRGLEPRFVGRMLAWFGEPVVVESLRRFENGWSCAIFVGVARNVERGMM